MNILQVNYTDIVGGAAKVAYTLHNGFRSRDHGSWMAVGKKNGGDSSVYSFSDVPSNRAGRALHSLGVQLERNLPTNLGGKFGRFFQQMARQPTHYFYKFSGVDDFDYSETWGLLLKHIQPPLNIVNLHNLHSNFFDLRYLPVLSRQIPTVITLHDTWLLSGHCAYSFDCERWRTGCGNCPYLDVDPPAMRDATAYNWRRKRSILQKTNLYIVSPSQWMLDKVKDSILQPAIKMSRIIRNGVDLSVFKPMKKLEARSILNLPQDAFICLFVAVKAQKNSFKDYKTIHNALRLVSNRSRSHKIFFIALGGETEIKMDAGVEINHVAFVGKLEDVALYYQAADVYLHAARAENFPNTVIEALACGTPVIATRVGGIPEQIEDGRTGFITPAGDEVAMADRILRILDSNEMRSRLSFNAVVEAKKRFDSENMVDEYHLFYEEVIMNWKETSGLDIVNSRE